MTQDSVSLNPETFMHTWSCGGYITLLGSHETRVQQWYCRSARCPTCGPLIQKKHFYKIRVSLERLSKAPFLYYKIITGLTGKARSNYLQRQTRGPYVCIASSPVDALILSTHQLVDKSAKKIHRSRLYGKLLPSRLELLCNGGGRVTLSTQVRAIWKSLCSQQQGKGLVDSYLMKAGLSNEEIQMLWTFWHGEIRRGGGVDLAAVPGVRHIYWISRTPLNKAMYLAKEWRRGARIYGPGQALISSVLLLTLLTMRLAQLQRKPFPLKSYLKRLVAMLP